MKDFRFLGYVVALAEHGHFAHAARTLGITQPALSQAIKRLEVELGARLFDRTRGKVIPTPFGEAALRHAKGLLRNSEELHREVALLKGLETGSLTVVAGTFAADLSGHRALGSTARKYPGIQCRLELLEWNRCAEVLLDRIADLALAEITVADKEPLLVSELINTQPGVFFCRKGHPILRRKELTVRDLSAYPWTLVPLPPRIYVSLGDLLPAAGRLDEHRQQFIPSIRVETLSGAMQVVSESDAISASPLRLIAEEVRRGDLVPIDVRAPWLRLNYGFIYLRDRMLSPAARAFMAEVRRIEDELAHSPKPSSPRHPSAQLM